MHNRGPARTRMNSDINVTPMADIMLVLLIIFMITTPLLQSGITVNLPKARHCLYVKPDEQVVAALTREGRLYLAKKLVSEEELGQDLGRRFEGEINKRVYLKADNAVSYGRVVQIVNQLRSAGVEQIGLMTEKEKQ